MTRPLYEIAAEIKSDWRPINFAARPYVDAMSSLNTMSDNYGADTASYIVRYFISNAGTWRGDVAKRVKAELKKMM